MKKEIKDLTGMIFGRWTVIEKAEKNYEGRKMWLCQCACDDKTVRPVLEKTLSNGESKSCGCLANNKPKDIIGQTFNRWMVIERATNDKEGRTRWLCECTCEKKTRKIIKGKNLSNGISQSCGCLTKEKNRAKIDLTGQIFGRLTVIRRAEDNKEGRSMWLCECNCGNREPKIALGKELINGHTKSCGCLHKEVVSNMMKTHGHTKRGKNTPEYNSWQGMRERCYNENNENYIDYGGRGIIVCDRWLNSFENFFEDMGYRTAPDYSLDRIDVNGNYSPENCRWADKKTQARNQRLNKNNKTGVKGVQIVKSGKFVVSIMGEGKNIHLGTFTTLEEASRIRKEAEEIYWS